MGFHRCDAGKIANFWVNLSGRDEIVEGWLYLCLLLACIFVINSTGWNGDVGFGEGVRREGG